MEHRQPLLTTLRALTKIFLRTVGGILLAFVAVMMLIGWLIFTPEDIDAIYAAFAGAAR